jgi:hypothetical protein
VFGDKVGSEARPGVEVAASDGPKERIRYWAVGGSMVESGEVLLCVDVLDDAVGQVSKSLGGSRGYQRG